MVHNTKVPAASTIQRYLSLFRNESYEGKLDMLRILLGVKFTDTSWLLMLQSVYCSLVEDEVPTQFQKHYRYFKATGEIKIFRGLNGENDKMHDNNSSSSITEVQENNAANVEDHNCNEIVISDSDSD